jgi:hypothetical protein
VAGQQKTFTKGFILQVRKGIFSEAWSYLLYAAAGILILIIALAIMGRRNQGSDDDIIMEKEKKEGRSKNDKSKIKKTDIRLR